MKKFTISNTLAQSFWPVKSFNSDIGSYSPDSMAHHKVSLSHKKKLIVSYSDTRGKPYGVPSPYRFFSPELLRKKFHLIRDCLTSPLRLSTAQRSATLELLTLQAYYPTVYPKASQIADQSGCSTRTFWRTIRRLEELGLVQRVPRFVFRPHAQISNLYLLKKLIILIVRYLAEHGVAFWEKWLKPYLTMPGSQFWRTILGDLSPSSGCPAFDSSWWIICSHR